MLLGLTGDVMLGRLIDRRLLADPAKDPAGVWGNSLDLFTAVHARFINLECIIATSGQADVRKVFCFRARPRALDALKAARVDFVGLANNHVLDYGPQALQECLALLRESGIAFAGAGMNDEEAAAPAAFVAGGRRFAVVAITDNEPRWEARENRPGVNFVAYGTGGLLGPYRHRVRDAIDTARAAAGCVIVCAHVGPNWGRPSAAMQAMARQVLDFGADLYWGHSIHSVQGIEFWKNKPILYSTGDFVDDYAVDAEERNDLSFFVEIEVGDGVIPRARLRPVRINVLQVNRAAPADARWLKHRIEVLSAPFGSRVEEEDDAVVVMPG